MRQINREAQIKQSRFGLRGKAMCREISSKRGVETYFKMCRQNDSATKKTRDPKHGKRRDATKKTWDPRRGKQRDAAKKTWDPRHGKQGEEAKKTQTEVAVAKACAKEGEPEKVWRAER
ncbi:hypothetical protein NDU88_004721 [Pleurodeles waltl]|uniref:Uncharacterized protein n=1 Tax=Pleurodeles waltl TaxID=8319 RepID=A0AAV7M7X6_PLEWA|nr:hypothetical protein NDU88_004721 [Pleurodeles waltl]